MPIDPEAQADDVYSSWEKHKLAVAGLSRLSLVTLSSAALLLLVDFILFREWRPPDAANGLVARVGLGVVMAAGAVVFGFARRARADFSHPFRVGSALLLLACGLGAYAAAAAGGPSGYFAFGLVPVLFAWPVLMPGGVRESVAPAAGGLGLHLLVVELASATGFGREGRVMVVVLVLALAATVACGQVIEFWRRRAAAASTTDWLTGALSRDFLTERLKSLCALRQRSLAPLSLVMLDVDRFKNINDSYGRNAGDEVLEMLATGVMGEIRGNDFVGRYGGDEFLLVLDECEGDHAVALVERLRRKVVDNPMTIGLEQVRVTFSVGVVSLKPGDPLVAPDLLRAAEKALETSKETGRNRTSVAGTVPMAEDPVTEP
ncbi:MAG: GGDEF domain-containing protein [Myxococcaceae bacterium]